MRRDPRPELDLEAFCHAQHPRLVRLLTLHCGDPETARDLAQDTLVRVCQHWRRVRRLDEPGAWVTRVALNLAVSHHRRTAVARRPEVAARLAQDLLAPTADDPDRAPGAPVDGWAVRAALLELPERQRTALVLRFFEDLAVERTADLMGVSPSAVKKLTARGVDHLRARLGTDLDLPSEVHRG